MVSYLPALLGLAFVLVDDGDPGKFLLLRLLLLDCFLWRHGCPKSQNHLRVKGSRSGLGKKEGDLALKRWYGSHREGESEETNQRPGLLQQGDKAGGNPRHRYSSPPDPA